MVSNINIVRISPKALSDMEEIKDYISDDMSGPDAAKNTIKKIVSRIESLSEHSEIGAKLSNIIGFDTDYRNLVCDNYLVFHYVDKNEVFVTRVIYGKRDYLKILFEDIES